jgi:hypothetical protein
LPINNSLKKSNVMTTQEFKAIATEKFSNISTNELIAESKKLMFDISDASDLVLEVITDILFERMPESEFIEYSKSL